MSELKLKINDDMKTAMRAKESARLGTLRLLLSAMKQKEVDERVTLDDQQIIAIIDKMLKQRRDSVSQFEAGKREDLAAIERAEIEVLMHYMPQALTPAEITAAIDSALLEATTAGASGNALLGKAMAILKPQMAGKADMAEVSKLLKAKIA